MANANNKPTRRHITTYPLGGWQVVASGAERASARSVIQGKAQIAARGSVVSLGGEVMVRRRGDRIHKSNTLDGARDSLPPRDQNQGGSR